MHAKAKLAGVLIRRAWEQSLQSGKAQPPWPSADLRPIARLQIPRLGYDEIVLEGATASSLAFGPTHMLSGARFGEPGNLLLAGHRTSWFLPLERIAQNDLIYISWFDSRRRARYARTYRVSLIRVVEATDFTMLAPTSGDALTLLTCYPFGRGAGSPQRYMVRALPAGLATKFWKTGSGELSGNSGWLGELVWLRLRILRRTDKEAALAASLV
jgi:sortase A